MGEIYGDQYHEAWCPFGFKFMKIGFFGFGNMGRAIGAAMESQHPDIEFFVYTPSGSFLLTDMPLDLDYYVLAFKPQSLESFNFEFLPEHKIISILAGVSLETLIKKFKVSKIARFMPNTASLYSQSAGLLFFSLKYSSSEKENTIKLLESTGKIFAMKSEDQLDCTTGFSGSGPGLIFELARIFEEELNLLTNNELPAREIIAQTFLGAATLMSEDTSTFVELRDNVTSKKGVTYEALEVLKENNLQSIFNQAFAAAFKRIQDFK
jgi:pyrroline-5-carboxylate reductase